MTLELAGGVTAWRHEGAHIMDLQVSRCWLSEIQKFSFKAMLEAYIWEAVPGLVCLPIAARGDVCKFLEDDWCPYLEPSHFSMTQTMTTMGLSSCAWWLKQKSRPELSCCNHCVCVLRQKMQKVTLMQKWYCMCAFGHPSSLNEVCSIFKEAEDEALVCTNRYWNIQIYWYIQIIACVIYMIYKSQHTSRIRISEYQSWLVGASIDNRGPEQLWPKYFCGFAFGHTKRVLLYELY